MIFVTHDQTEALSMSDRILVLKAGRILQTGTPEEVYRRPVTPEVARQLGQPAINLLAVRRQRGMHVTGDGVVTVPARDGDAAAGTLGIRPEDIEPFGGPAKGKVVVVEDLGAERTLLVRMGSQEIHILVGRGRDFRPGDEVAPSMNPERAILWPGADAGS
jgi:multiple sugar transport system ATP-binding protein